MTNVSRYVTLDKAIYSVTAIKNGINNNPNNEQIKNISFIATNIYDKIVEWYKSEPKITSFFRSSELNKKVGGASNSQHLTGEAFDFTTGNKGENKKIFEWIKNNLQFDQLIDEHDYEWIHVSLKNGLNRNQILHIGLFDTTIEKENLKMFDKGVINTVNYTKDNPFVVTMIVILFLILIALLYNRYR